MKAKDEQEESTESTVAPPDPSEPTIHYGEANLVLDTTTGKEEEE